MAEDDGEDTMEDWGQRDPRWADVRTRWVDVSGVPIRLLTVEGQRDGTPQLLVHGLGGSATNWLEVAAPLAQHGPVVAPDLPGFGRTEPPYPRAARVRNNVRFVPALCERLGFDRVVLYGNSMGGMIATLVAAERPGLVERLVLVNPALPAPIGQVHHIDPEIALRFAPFVVKGLGKRVMERVWSSSSPDEIYDETLELVHHDPSRVKPALRDVAIENLADAAETDWYVPAFAEATESLVGQLMRPWQLFRAVEQIVAHTLLVWGDEDQLVRRPVIDGLRERRPDWDVHVFEGVGHVPMVEVADAFLEVLDGWLEDDAGDRAEQAVSSSS